MKKDIDYYLNHPDETPDDLEALEALADGGEVQAQAEGEPDENHDGEAAASDAGQDGGKKENVKPEGEPGAKEEEEVRAPIQAKDGKHTIPYSVLEGTRKRAERADRLEEVVAHQADKIKELESQLKTGKDGHDGAKEADISSEDLAMIREEFPEFAKVLEAQSAQIMELREVIGSRQANEEQDQQRTVATMVQDTIDSIPKLAHIQTNNPDLFARAVVLDESLKSDPANAGLPLKDRFLKALKGVEAMYGEISLPGNAPSAREIAQQKLGSAMSAPPNSLSDLPSGEAHKHSQKERIESMPAAEVGALMMDMTDDQLDAYLNSL